MIHWESWSSAYPSAKYFNTETGLPDWREPRQGRVGNCYLMAGLAGVAEFPDLIRNMFITKEKNTAGITQVRFFIRGKPWVFDIDDQFLIVS